MDGVRIKGVVESKHLHDGLGSYGTIKAEDGKVYLYYAGSVYRNCSHAAIGASVTFEAVGYRYAIGINDCDKG